MEYLSRIHDAIKPEFNEDGSKKPIDYESIRRSTYNKMLSFSVPSHLQGIDKMITDVGDDYYLKYGKKNNPDNPFVADRKAEYKAFKKDERGFDNRNPIQKGVETLFEQIK